MENRGPMGCSIRKVSLLVLVITLSGPVRAEAYIGPGAGISAIGTVVALLGAILLAIVGFIWYPIKRLLLKFRKKRDRNLPS